VEEVQLLAKVNSGKTEISL